MRELTVPPVVTVADDVNLTDVVWRNAEEYPDTVQFSRLRGSEWEPVTTRQFRDEVVAVARGLIASGLAPGDRIGLMSKTRYEWTLLDYAIWAAGGVTVPVYETSSSDQVEWILSNSGAVACLVETPDHRALVDDLRDRLTELKQVWTIDDDAVGSLVEAGGAVPPEQVDERRRSRGADDVATLIYTSGTTGRPKGCMLTHRNLAADIQNTVPGLLSLFNERSATLLFLPLAHSFARIIQVGVVQARARMGHTADVKNLLPDLQSFRPTFLLAVPRVFEKVYNGAKQKAHGEGKGAIFDRAERVAIAYSKGLTAGRIGLGTRIQHAVFDKLVYSKLRAAMGGQCVHAISGGAPLGERLAHFFRGVGVTVYEGYGMTETSPVIAVSQEHKFKIGTVGLPIPGSEVRIADDGELLVKGDHVFAGYWGNDEATAEAFTADGFFHTGDLAELDDEGFLTITGRKKEIIVTAGGKNVAPAVLEDRVRAHPLVSQCMVVGDRQPFIAALVTLDPESLPDWLASHGKPAGTSAADLATDPDVRAEIQAAVDEANRAVSRAEAIKVFRILPRDFSEETGEMTPSLKVKRGVVLKEYADEIAAIYT
ncbi:AMP-dependent synthetase/ligase [Actinocatenispora rupis]|uniref:Acyl-CoA synthetase n=1 Tax=Actinocatenispora rupis TaxID=519421 RepID=A0A8J3NDZ0_9ACTN|nr:AMP-dependent synthetase/ligase [Actinocatenispora rupis]GID13492.1 long-chain acyl-CoA synthetase [Actinocatenispora rupis]